MPRYAWPQLAELPWQQWLAFKIIELLLMVRVPDQRTDILKQGRSVRSLNFGL
jgi:hypothetical protein